MKITLYMAISIDGFIARKDDDTSWISVTEWNSYSTAVQKTGCLIVGHRTYNILTNQPEFEELKDVKLVVVSKDNLETKQANHFVAHSPKEALEILKDFSEVILAGGGALNASFLAENLIDEIYLDIEPRILGEGISLFRGKSFETKLQLLGTKKLSENEIQLHYKVLK